MGKWAHDSVQETIEFLARSGRADLAADLNRVLETVNLDDTEILRCPEAEAVLDELVEVESLSHLKTTMERIAEIFEVDHCTLYIVREGTRQFFQTQVVTTYPDTWVHRYVEAGFQHADPVMRQSQVADAGFYWDSLDFSAPLSQRVLDEATKFGIGPSGYTSLVTTEYGDVFGVSVSSTRSSEAFREHLDPHIPDVAVLSSYLAEAFVHSLSDRREAEIRPTDDQLLVLRGIAEGMTWEETIATELRSGSFKTVAQSICKTFETDTVIQAAIYAARLGLLDNAPFAVGNIFTSSSRNISGKVICADNVSSLRRWARVRTGNDVLPNNSLQASGS